MPTPLRRRLRLARRGAWYFVAGLLVCMAVVLGIASQVLPLAERNPEKIAAWLSARAGRPIAFDSVDTEWTRRGPLLRLDKSWSSPQPAVRKASSNRVRWWDAD